MKRKFSVKRLDKSFKYAFTGYKNAFHSEPNMKFHTFIAFIVLISGLFFKLSSLEWIFIISLIGLVIGAELLNTAIEHLVDLATQEYKRKAMLAKDTSAAYVMVLSITAAIVGMIIFIPKIIELIRGVL
ncbi:MAG: diacylglycerol kinase family protein [Bacilli bacterium]|nr:diacylglycerol kinase family protein [Bacilli bacterium]